MEQKQTKKRHSMTQNDVNVQNRPVLKQLGSSNRSLLQIEEVTKQNLSKRKNFDSAKIDRKSKNLDPGQNQIIDPTLRNLKI